MDFVIHSGSWRQLSMDSDYQFTRRSEQPLATMLTTAACSSYKPRELALGALYKDWISSQSEKLTKSRARPEGKQGQILHSPRAARSAASSSSQFLDQRNSLQALWGEKSRQFSSLGNRPGTLVGI